MSVKEKVLVKDQVRIKETSESEPPVTYRNPEEDVKTGMGTEIQDKSKRRPENCLGGIRYEGGVTLIWAFVRNVGNMGSDEKGNPQGEGSSERKSTEAETRGGLTCSSDEVSVMGMERRGWIVQPD